MSPGVYLITNLVNGKVWVGQSNAKKGILQRCKGHLCAFKAGNNSKHLQKAWDKYGEKSFSFEALVSLTNPTQEELDEHENYFIFIFRSYERDYGYNLNKRASGKGKLPQETIQKMAQFHKGKKRSDTTRARISKEAKNRFNLRPAEGLKIRTCIVCGKEFYRRSGGWRGIKCCSKECSNRLVSDRASNFSSQEQSVKTKGYKWVHKEGETKRIPQEEVGLHLNSGWSLGRGSLSLSCAV
jgi:group I intron endonuclease